MKSSFFFLIQGLAATQCTKIICICDNCWECLSQLISNGQHVVWLTYGELKQFMLNISISVRAKGIGCYIFINFPKTITLLLLMKLVRHNACLVQYMIMTSDIWIIIKNHLVILKDFVLESRIPFSIEMYTKHTF